MSMAMHQPGAYIPKERDPGARAKLLEIDDGKLGPFGSDPLNVANGLLDKLEKEVALTQQRLKSIANRGCLLIKGLHARGEALGSNMEAWLEARFTAEVASSTGFAAQVREAIEGEELLVHDITLEDTEFQIDEGTRLVPYVSDRVEESAETERGAARVSRGSLAQRGRLRSRASRSCALRTVLTSLRGEHSTAKLALRGEPDLRRSGLWRGAVVTPVFTELLRSATRERAVVLANDEVRELGSSRVAPSWLDSPSTRLA